MKKHDKTYIKDQNTKTNKHWHKHTLADMHKMILQSIFLKYRGQSIFTQKSIFFYPDGDIAQNEKVALYSPNSSRTVRILAENGRAAIALLRPENGTKRQTKCTNGKFWIFALESTEIKRSILYHYNSLIESRGALAFDPSRIFFRGKMTNITSKRMIIYTTDV